MALREELERARVHPVTGSEEAVKVRVVLPILGSLGWDWTDPNHVDFEYAVGTRRQRGQVDIVLREPRDANVALIEVKAPGKQLDEFVDQLMEYAFNDSAGICVLTTGFVWWLYLPRADGIPSERRFAELDVLQDPVDQLIDDFETYLSRSSLLDRSAQKRAQQALDAGLEAERLMSEIPRVWQQMLDEPDHDLVHLVENRVFRSVRLRPTTDQITAVLRDKSPSSHPVPPSPAPPKSTHKRDDEIVRLRDSGMSYNEIGQALNLSHTRVRNIYLHKTDGRTRRTPPHQDKTQRGHVTGFVLRGELYMVTKWKDVFLGVAEALYKQRAVDFDRATQLRGTRRQYISRSQDDLAQPQRIGDSPYFADVQLNATGCVRRARDLLELFGYQRDDLEVIEE